MREEKEKVNKELHLEVEAGDDHVSVGGDDGDVLAHDPLIHVNHVTWRETRTRTHAPLFTDPCGLRQPEDSVASAVISHVWTPCQTS